MGSNMKNLLKQSVTIIFALSVTSFAASVETSTEEATPKQVISKEQSAILDSHLLSKYSKREISEIKSTPINLIYSASFYSVKIIDERDNSTDLIVYKNGDSFLELAELNNLIPLIKPTFKIDTKEKVEYLDKTLTKLNIDTFSRPAKAIHKKEKSWILVKNDSFGEISGIVIAVDDKGTVTSIKRESNIEL